MVPSKKYLNLDNIYIFYVMKKIPIFNQIVIKIKDKAIYSI